MSISTIDKIKLSASAADEITELMLEISTDVEVLSEETVEMMVYLINAYGIRDTDELFSSIARNVRYKYGIPESIGIKFARHGVYVVRGAGKGYGGLIGSRWRTSKGELRETNPNSKGKMGTGPYKKRDWFNLPMDILETRLEEIIEKHYGDATLKVLRMK